MKICCMGDSITYGYGLEDLSCRWTDLVAARTGHTLINLGISGDTTGGMLARCQTEVFPCEPDAIIILGGVNDIAYTMDYRQVCANMVAMTRQAIVKNLKIFIGLPLPVVPEVMPRIPWDPERNHTKVAALLEPYSNFLKHDGTNKGFHIVDFRSQFLNSDGSPRNELFLDGVHPNAEGHRLMAEVLCRVLEDAGYSSVTEIT